MDPLTHTLAGAAMSQSFRRPLTRIETATLLIGVNLPDVDALSYFVNSDLAFGFRRGWTHGLPAVAIWTPVLSGALLILARLLRREVSFMRLSWLAAIAVASHPILDWLNTYGMRFLAPFTDRWFYGDALFIIDPWVWLLIGGGCWLARPAIGRVEAAGWCALVLAAGAMILGSGAVPAAAKGIWAAGLVLIASARRVRSLRPVVPARGGVLLAAAYAAAMISIGSFASASIRSQLASGGIGPIESIMVGPVVADPLAHDVVVRTRDGYRIGTWRWLDRPRLSLEEGLIEKPPDTPIVRAALTSPEVRGTMRWMRFPVVEVEPDGDGHLVRIMDLRYVRHRRTGFGVTLVRVPAPRCLPLVPPGSDQAK